MHRRMTVTLAGEEVTLAATFDASMEILEKVHDPLAIAKDAALEMQLAAMGQVYDPRFKWTVRNVPLAIWAGMKAAGDKRDLRAVQEMVFKHGMIECSAVAIEFITMLVTPTTEEASDEKGGGSGE